MWTWTKAHEFTHDDEGDQVMALFSHSPEREEQKKKKLILRGFFFRLRTGRFFLAVFSASVTFVYGDSSLVRAEFNLKIFTSTNRC